MVQKPTVIVKKEFEKDVTELINKTPLPAFVMVDVIRDVLRALNNVAEQEYARETEAYQKALEEENQKQEEMKLVKGSATKK